MKRQCQGRVYWNGPLAPHRDWPNKLEREKTYKLLDTQQFLQRKCPPAVLGARGLLDPAPGDPSPLGNGVSSCPGTAAAGCGAAGTSCPLTEPVSCRAAGVPEPRAAHATVPDPPVLRGGVPHQHRAPLPETHHGPREYAPGLALAVAPSWEPGPPRSGGTRTRARSPSALCLRRWSRCSHGNSSITPSAWGRCCSTTPPSPAPLVLPATLSASSNSSASPEPGQAGGKTSRKEASERDALPPHGPAPATFPEPVCTGQSALRGRTRAGTGRGGRTAAVPAQITGFIPREPPRWDFCVLVW